MILPELLDSVTSGRYLQPNYRLDRVPTGWKEWLQPKAAAGDSVFQGRKKNRCEAAGAGMSRITSVWIKVQT